MTYFEHQKNKDFAFACEDMVFKNNFTDRAIEKLLDIKYIESDSQDFS